VSSPAVARILQKDGEGRFALARNIGYGGPRPFPRWPLGRRLIAEALDRLDSRYHLAKKPA
jgi:hypothetical protein